jgi:hypothetical protein
MLRFAYGKLTGATLMNDWRSNFDYFIYQQQQNLLVAGGTMLLRITRFFTLMLALLGMTLGVAHTSERIPEWTGSMSYSAGLKYS